MITLKTVFSKPDTSSRETPKMIRGFMNLCHTKMFSRLLHSTYPVKRQKMGLTSRLSYTLGKRKEEHSNLVQQSAQHETVLGYEHA